MSENSAHEDIETYASYEEVANSVLGNNPDVMRVFEILQSLQEVKSRPPALLSHQVLELDFRHGATRARFEGWLVKNEGWVSHPFFRATEILPQSVVNLDQADIDALGRREFTLCLESVAPSSASPAINPYRLDELLADMDLYGIGRPSTISEVLRVLEEELDLIEINAERDEVSLTEVGQTALETLQAKAGDLASAGLSAELNALFQLVERGELSPYIPIQMVYRRIHGEPSGEEIEAQRVWETLDHIYQDERLQRRYPEGFIRRRLAGKDEEVDK